MNYNGEPFKIKIGKSIMPLRYGKETELEFIRGGWQRILCLGESRMGKSAIAKHIAVLVSKVRKVCIFSVYGEWEKHVTEYSAHKKCPYRQKLTDFKILDDYCVKISDFSDTASLIALGFSSDSLYYLGEVINNCFNIYEDDPRRFLEILKRLPTRADEVEDFINAYGVNLGSPIHTGTKQNLILHFKQLEDMFHQGEDEEREYYDFGQEWLDNDHLIINITSNSNKARALAGLILRHIKIYHIQTKGFFIFEEFRFLFPNILETTLRPSSLLEIYDMLTLHSKKGIAILGISQKRDQIYEPGLDHFFTYISGRSEEKFGDRIDLSTLRWNPNSNYREMIIYNKDGSWDRFVPSIACCKV